MYFNMLNHLLIGSVSLYATWRFYNNLRSGDFPEYQWHVWLSIIGYQLLMAEAILTLYSSNSWSFFHSTKTKRTLHWVIQVIGSICAISGTVILYPTRRKHFYSIHGITGLVSLIILVIGAINGIVALWSREFYKIVRVKPVVSKFFHNFVGVSAYVIGRLIILKFKHSRCSYR